MAARPLQQALQQKKLCRSHKISPWCKLATYWMQAAVNPHAVEEATRLLQQALRDAQLRQRDVAREIAMSQVALQAALARREALEVKVQLEQ